jgi:hypothetical protein
MSIKKSCVRCKEEKEIAEFYKNKNTKDGFQSYCKKCEYIINKENKKKYQQKSEVKKQMAQSMAKYFKTDKGKLALKKACSKYYKKTKVNINNIKIGKIC